MIAAKRLKWLKRALCELSQGLPQFLIASSRQPAAFILAVLPHKMEGSVEPEHSRKSASDFPNRHCEIDPSQRGGTIPTDPNSLIANWQQLR